MVNQNKTLIFSSALFGILTGLLIPLFFVILDLRQMGLPPTGPNIIDLFDLQTIYFFAAALFPILFGALFFLLARLALNNELLDDQGQYMRDLIDSLDSFIAVTDSAGHIEMSNQAYKDLIKVIPHSGDIENIQAILQNETLFRKTVEKRKLPPTEITIDIGGTFGHFVLSVTTFHKTNEGPEEDPLYIYSLKDIHQLKEKERIIKEQEANIQHNARLSSLGEMAAGIAHEINNPLSIIAGNNFLAQKLLSKDPINREEIFELLQDSDEVVDRITRIINGLKNISRNGESDSFELVKIGDAIVEAVELCKMRIHGTDITLDIQDHVLLKSDIKIQRIQFSQVLVNLLNNAVDAACESPSKWIKVSFEQDKQWTYIKITDSGNGIPRPLEQKIFEPLFTTKRAGKGTGLGLSLSRRIILDHQGELFFNHAHLNTQIVIRLPRALVLAA